MARWSQKDYELVASLIAEERMVGEPDMEREETARQETLDGLVERFAATFEADNPLFRRKLFVKRSREIKSYGGL